jgi:hypothetical protein
MPTVVCPNCKKVYEFDSVRREATEFCTDPTCDYPLFWAIPERVAVAKGNGNGESDTYRLPGTSGKMTIGFRQCPVCEERNTMGAKHCVHCGASLDKPPPPKTVLITAPPPKPVVVAPPPDEPIPWLVLALVILAGVIAVILSVR